MWVVAVDVVTTGGCATDPMKGVITYEVMVDGMATGGAHETVARPSPAIAGPIAGGASATQLASGSSPSTSVETASPTRRRVSQASRSAPRMENPPQRTTGTLSQTLHRGTANGAGRGPRWNPTAKTFTASGQRTGGVRGRA